MPILILPYLRLTIHILKFSFYSDKFFIANSLRCSYKLCVYFFISFKFKANTSPGKGWCYTIHYTFTHTRMYIHIARCLKPLVVRTSFRFLELLQLQLVMNFTTISYTLLSLLYLFTSSKKIVFLPKHLPTSGSSSLIPFFSGPFAGLSTDQPFCRSVGQHKTSFLVHYKVDKFVL